MPCYLENNPNHSHKYCPLKSIEITSSRTCFSSKEYELKDCPENRDKWSRYMGTFVIVVIIFANFGMWTTTRLANEAVDDSLR